MATVVINLIACSAKANYNNPTDNVALLLMQLISPLVGNSITINGDTADTTPPVFAGLTSATAASSTSITLNWAAGTDNITPQETLVYDIYAATISGGENFSLVSFSSTAGAVTYTVTGLTANTAYYFIVRARDSAGNRDSNIVQKTALTAPLPTVTSISPTTGTMGTPITISGTNFDTTLANNIVTLPNCTLQVVSATKTQIVAIPPITGECNSGGITVQTTSSNIPSSSYGNFSYYNTILFSGNSNGTITSFFITANEAFAGLKKIYTFSSNPQIKQLKLATNNEYLYYLGTVAGGVLKIGGDGNLSDFTGIGSTNFVTGGLSMEYYQSRIYISGLSSVLELNPDGTIKNGAGLGIPTNAYLKISSYGSYIYAATGGTIYVYALSPTGSTSYVTSIPGDYVFKDDLEHFLYISQSGTIFSYLIWSGGFFSQANPPYSYNFYPVGTLFKTSYSVPGCSGFQIPPVSKQGIIFCGSNWATYSATGQIVYSGSVSMSQSTYIDDSEGILYTANGNNYYKKKIFGGTELSSSTLGSSAETSNAIIVVKKYR